MERNILHFLSVLSVLLSLFSCSKAMDIDAKADSSYTSSEGPFDDRASLAIGTVREQAGVRYIQLDPKSAAYVINPSEIQEIPSGTRVFLEYRRVLSSETPAFCTEAILVEWTSPLDVGEIRYELNYPENDPVSVIADWITSVEDGFLTIHYCFPSKGKASHDFSLYPLVTCIANEMEFRLVHEAHGDTEGTTTDGIICFPIGNYLSDTEDTITIQLTYIDLDRTRKTLTFDYRSPK